MKVYHSKSEKTKKRPSKKALVSIGVSLALFAAALAITLTLALGNNPAIIPEPDPEPANTLPVFVLPVDSYEVGKTFNDRALVKYVTFNGFRTHEGLDFIVESGAEIKAIFDGTIISIDANTTMEGTVIKIQHSDGIVSVYKGLGLTEAEVNQTVKSGDVIGVVGRFTLESREYDSPHLHLEVLKNDKTIDPLNYLPEIGDK